MKKAFVALVLGVMCIPIYLLIATPLFSNLWDVTTGKGFIIPRESSVLAFKVTEANSGSGEWWIYGKDDRNFYHFIGGSDVKYVFIPVESAKICPGFKEKDVSTWCKQFIKEVK